MIDLDHLAVGDPAIDLAPLVGVVGVRALAATVDATLLRRAMLHRATLPLQVAVAAELAGLPHLREHAWSTVTTRVSAGTVWDPHGTRPGAV